MDNRKLFWLFLLPAAGVIFVVYFVFSPLSPKDTWPPKNEEEEAKLIAGYKDKLATPDNPFSSKKPEDIPIYLSRIIDHDVKKGNLKSARDYITQAIGQKLDGQVESLAGNADAKALIAKVRSGVKKRDDLNAVVAKYADAPKDTQAKFDRELAELSNQFCKTPFDPVACPELADEIVKTYKTRLEPARQDARLKDVIAEVEKNCMPPKKDSP